MEVVKRVHLKRSHQKKEIGSRDMMKILANAMVVIILQHIRVSNQHVSHLKLTQCYVNRISIKLDKIDKRRNHSREYKGNKQPKIRQNRADAMQEETNSWVSGSQQKDCPNLAH